MTTNQIEQLRFRPLRYQRIFEYWKLARLNPWNVFELDYFKDIQNWKNDLSEMEKNAILRSFCGFTQAEQLVGDYWVYIGENNVEPEIKMMAREFSAQEANHLYAYNYTEENLGLDTFDDFIANAAATQKIETIMNHSYGPGNALAVFSGAVEGCSLFTIFALLASFCNDNKMKTVKEILGWSAVDEEMHSQAGIYLFHAKKDEYGYDEEVIIQGFDAVIQNEIDFLDYVMQDGDLPSRKKEDLVSYLYLRANNKLDALKIDEDYRYVLTPEQESAARVINREMIAMTTGKTHGDFFAGKLSEAYTATVRQNYKVLDYPSKHNLFKDYVRLSVK
jgi:ribonucleoside-diphosphate reductase beta chain